jgi:hypothetical protein
MLRTLLFSILSLSLVLSEGVSERLTLLGKHFVMKTESYDLYDTKGKVMKLYQKLQNGERKYLLTFVLNETTGGCRKTSMEKGSYEMNGSQVIFYTSWERQGGSDAPYGARIQRYMIDMEGEFKRLSSKIYIETERKSDANQSAMQYLFHTPENQHQKEALQKYVQGAEKRFKGIFVFGKEAESLIREVKEALHRKMQKRWH